MKNFMNILCNEFFLNMVFIILNTRLSIRNYFYIILYYIEYNFLSIVNIK